MMQWSRILKFKTNGVPKTVRCVLSFDWAASFDKRSCLGFFALCLQALIHFFHYGQVLSCILNMKIWFKWLAMSPLILMFIHYFESTLEHPTLWKTTKARIKSGSFTCIEHIYNIIKQPMHDIQNFTFISKI
jgi:hypothetical protein